MLEVKAKAKCVPPGPPAPSKVSSRARATTSPEHRQSRRPHQLRHWHFRPSIAFSIVTAASLRRTQHPLPAALRLTTSPSSLPPPSPSITTVLSGNPKFPLSRRTANDAASVPTARMSSMRAASSSSRAVTRGAATFGASSPRRNGYGAVALRPAVLGLAKLLFLPLASAAPLLQNGGLHAFKHGGDEGDDMPKDASDPDLYVYLGVAVALVLLGGAFAGLTIALMGQDETYLQVIATSGEGAERRHAKRVLRLLNKGKHWVLVTLLLSNVITNETLPIVLDRSLGGGWPAVVSSTVLIGE